MLVVLKDSEMQDLQSMSSSLISCHQFLDHYLYVLRNKTYRGVVGVPKGCVSVDISAAPPSVAISILIIIVENWNFIRVSKSKLYTRSYAVQCQLIYIFCVINTNKQGVCLISGKIYYTQHIYKETLQLKT